MLVFFKAGEHCFYLFLCVVCFTMQEESCVQMSCVSISQASSTICCSYNGFCRGQEKRRPAFLLPVFKS